MTKVASCACEVHCTSLEMERSRYTTHSTVAFRRTTAGGNSESRTGSQKTPQVESSVRAETPADSEISNRTHPIGTVVLDVGA